MNIAKRKMTEKLAWTIRQDVIRQCVKVGFGHIGGSMSIVEVLAVLYEDVMHYDSNNPKWTDRDYLIVSKGHAGPAVYAVLAEKGFFPKDWLEDMNLPGTHLPSHADANKVPGVDFCTGSLGQGLAPALGAALVAKKEGLPNRFFCIIGDGESQEGMIWESVLSATKFRLDNLTVFLDHNYGQVDGCTLDVMPNERLEEKFSAFGWHVQTVDGHDVEAIYSAIQVADRHRGDPSVIILETQKGFGFDEITKQPLAAIHHMKISVEFAERAIAAYQKQIDLLV